MNEHSPIVSEFATPEDAAAYEQWLTQKVARSLADPRLSVPHDEAMARVRAMLAAKASRGERC